MTGGATVARPRPEATAPDATRARLIDAAAVVVGRVGPRKLALSDVAREAGVSRPTLYRYFGSKDELLEAVSAYEQQRFVAGLIETTHGRPARERLVAALDHVVSFQQAEPFQALVAIEPAFVLEQLALVLPAMRAGLARLLVELEVGGHGGATAEEVADVIVRTALSHFLIPGGDAAQLRRELHHAAGLTGADR